MQSGYIPTIGLEIHAELATRTKMFCDSPNDPFAAEPNTNICPVCLAHPGTLPVINREAVRLILRVGVALGGRFADYTEFDRKNYFYPDLPKGYQISQYEYPLVSGGELNGVSITRVHLEEDTATSIHDDERNITLIDFNRAGVPLMELVTEPVITSAKQAGDFARELQLLLRYLGASGANMEKGEMRVEANVSVGRAQSTRLRRGFGGEAGTKAQTLGTKVEIKNLNSFRAMERAVEHEIKRQTELLERGERVLQETRGWDEAKQATFPQRVKEESADYRYFPDPDLPSLRLSEITDLAEEALRAELPELPSKRRERYVSLGAKPEHASLYARSTALGNFFERVVEEVKKGKEGESIASNYIANDLTGMLRDFDGRDTETKPEIPISASHFAKIIRMLEEKRISSRGAKDILALAIKDDTDPERIAKERNLLVTQEDIAPIVKKTLGTHGSVVDEYRAGKKAALEYLVGQVMRALKGRGDPAEVRKVVLEKIL